MIRWFALPTPLVLVVAACSSSSGGSGAADGGSGPTGPTFVLSPACGKPGDDIGMKLAKNNVPPRCVSTTDFAVEFAGVGVTQPAKAGLSSDGYCEIDVPIPAGAQTGRVTVKTAGDTYVSSGPLTVPCP